jgi:ABC-type nitrate/sulfonate/bicarbonate transport system substrate-binding protein
MRWVLLSVVCVVTQFVPETGAHCTERLRVDVFPGPQHLALYVAQEKGLFAERGLSVDIVFTPTAKAQREALADGSVEIAQSAVDNAVAMVDAMNQNVVIVAGGGNGMLDLFVRPEIKSYDDIRGKSVVVDSPDTAYAFVLYRMLELKGIKRSEYGVYQGGDCMRRLNGLRSDPKNAAALLNFPCNVLAAREGYPDWGSAADALGAYQADGVFVLRSWAQAHGEQLVSYLAAIIDGLRWASDPAHRAETVAIVAKTLKVATDVAERSVAGAIGPHGGLDPDARINRKGLETLLGLRAEMTGAAAAEAAEKYLDLTYYDRALASVK